MSKVSQKSRCLIMCMTPLQMLIAEKIIKLNSSKDFDLLVIALNDNDKYKYYYQRLRNLCLSNLYYTTKLGLNGFTDYLKNLKANKLNRNYQELYLASIDCRHFQYIVSKNNLACIYTFDDGTANINPSSLYYENSKPKFIKRLLWRTLGVRHYMCDIKEKSILHYTIYQNIPNIIINKIYIPLIIEENYNKVELHNEVVRFFLGQPLSDEPEIINIPFVESSINKLAIDYYYPHPRENIYPEGDFQIVESSLIFEDYIIQFLKDNINTKIEVFSVVSTALLNIMSLNRVKVTYIHNSQIFQLYHDFYKFSKELFGISSIDIGEKFE